MWSSSGVQWEGLDKQMVLVLVSSVCVCVGLLFTCHCFSSAVSLTYRLLQSSQVRADWLSRCVSSVHAVVVVLVATWIVVVKGDSVEAERPLLESSRAVETVLCGSIGYFIFDLFFMWGFMYQPVSKTDRRPDQNGPIWSTSLHHIVGIVSFAVTVGFRVCQIYPLLFLFTEISTPFLNQLFFSSMVYGKNSVHYQRWGIAFTIAFFLCRIPFVAVYLPIHLYRHILKDCLPHVVVGLVLSQSSLAIGLNLFWFNKIVRGLLKVIRGRSEKSDQDGNEK